MPYDHNRQLVEAVDCASCNSSLEWHGPLPEDQADVLCNDCSRERAEARATAALCQVERLALRVGELAHLEAAITRNDERHAEELAAVRKRAEHAESHVEELQAEALGIEEGAPPEGTTTGQAILAIRATRTGVERLRAFLVALRNHSADSNIRCSSCRRADRHAPECELVALLRTTEETP